MPEEALDSASIKILTALQLDGRKSIQELSEAIGLSSAPCWRRVKRLEATGVIARYAAIVDPAKVGLSACMLTRVRLERHSAGAVERFEAAVLEVPEIMECYVTTGDADYLLKIVVANNQAFEKVLHGLLARAPGIAQVESSVALRVVKHDTALPLGRARHTE